MIFGKYIAIVAVLASSLSLNAFAKDKNETHVWFSERVQIGSNEVKPGDYKLRWDGNGPDVKVQVVKDKDVVATVPAKLLANESTRNGNAVTGDAVTISGNGDIKQLDRVDFARGRQSLVFGEGMDTQATNGQR
jgi:hypothetical protein